MSSGSGAVNTRQKHQIVNSVTPLVDVIMTSQPQIVIRVILELLRLSTKTAMKPRHDTQTMNSHSGHISPNNLINPQANRMKPTTRAANLINPAVAPT